MVIAGIVLLVVAAGALWYARSERGEARRVSATETLTCGDLTTLSSGVAGEVGGGSFRQRCEVAGTVAPAEAGVLKAPESGVEAVWHRTKVTHRYWEMERRSDKDGVRHERVEKSETVSDEQSETPFLVRDDSGAVLVSPAGAEIDGPEEVLDRFDPADAGQSVAEGLLSSLLRSGSGSGTIGFRHEEWVLRPGARVFVHGEAADAAGTLSFSAPADGGDFIVSTRSEEQIVGSARRNAAIATAVAVVAALAGLGLLGAGLA